MVWAPDYVTVPELADYVKADDTDTTYVTMAMTAASRAVDDACSGAVARQFGNAAGERFYRPWPDYRRDLWVATIDDIQTVSGLVVKLDGVVTTDYVLEPRNAAANGKPWTAITLGSSRFDEVSITGTWGWTTVPATVKNATLIQAGRFFKRRDSLFGVAGSPESGSEVRLLAKADPDVAFMLRSFRRPGGIG